MQSNQCLIDPYLAINKDIILEYVTTDFIVLLKQLLNK